jgi:hypothetical protein
MLDRPPMTARDVLPVYLHDYYGPGRHAKAVWIHSKHYADDGLTYREERPLSGRSYGMDTVVAEVSNVEFPTLLDPVDDLPPTTAITQVKREGPRTIVRGTTADNGVVKKVLVNGHEARMLAPNFGEWEVVLSDIQPGELTLTAHAEDAAGNVEKRPHVRAVP